jgi:F-type H+-transporting ATPase subunit a
LSSIFKLFASESGIHISLKAEPVTVIGPVTITNSILYGFICALFAMFVLVLLTRAIKLRPKKGVANNALEYIVEFIINMLQSPFGNREKAAKYTPVFGTFFLFIIFSNLMGLLPWVGSYVSSGTTPLFRPLSADLNGTIAMAVIAIVYIQYLSIREQGIKGHFKHYFSDKPWNPINFFIGLLEVLGELTRIMSLSLRLFLNTAVGEILIAVFASLVVSNSRTPLLVIPVFMFEVLVAGIQAYVFTILTATYLGLATQHADHGDTHEVHHAPDMPKAKVEAIRT